MPPPSTLRSRTRCCSTDDKFCVAPAYPAQGFPNGLFTYALKCGPPDIFTIPGLRRYPGRCLVIERAPVQTVTAAAQLRRRQSEFHLVRRPQDAQRRTEGPGRGAVRRRRSVHQHGQEAAGQ